MEALVKSWNVHRPACIYSAGQMHVMFRAPIVNSLCCSILCRSIVVIIALRQITNDCCRLLSACSAPSKSVVASCMGKSGDCQR